MNAAPVMVSIHPYFKIRPGNLEAVRALLPALVTKTATEPKNLFYDFTLDGEVLFCREGYADAEGLVAHLDNVGPLVAEMLKLADLTRVEVHGPAAELAKLAAPPAALKPVWFAYVCGVPR